MKHLVVFLLLGSFVLPSLHAEECPEVPFTPTLAGTAGWIEAYNASISNANGTYVVQKSPDDVQWDGLRVMPLLDPVTFQQWDKVDGVWVQSETTIEEPVIVVTWAFVSLPTSSTGFELGETLSNRRIMQRYVTSEDESGFKATLWFTKHGNAAEYLDEIGIQRECLNLSLNESACDEAINWGVPTVGVPYGFQQTSLDQPYENVIGAWWREYMLIGIADRRAFIRPSYNPTVSEDSPAWKTDNGVPVWSEDRGQYWYAPEGSAEYDAQQAAIDDPSGAEAFQFKAYNGNGSVTTDFKAWLADWQAGSWMPAQKPGDNCGVYGFPYTSIGLTANWQFATEGPELDSRFLCLSEFILKADAPVWWFGRRSGTQYLGESDPDIGQVSWCDSCWGDLDMSGAIDTSDLMMIIDAWASLNPCMDFAFDYSSTQDCPVSEVMNPVGIEDLLWILEHWGPCDGWPEGLQSLRPADCY